jgi:DNA polymerase-3 subunit delta'
MPRTPKAAEIQASPFLPIPEPLLRHHSEVLARVMKQWKGSGKVPPVLLVSGPGGIGKTAIIHYLAQWLLCSRTGLGKSMPQEDTGPDLFGGAPLGDAPTAAEAESAGSDPLRPCGECPSCQKALRNTWVDFTEIAALNEDGSSGTLKVEQFRELKSTMGFGAYDGAFRITAIRDADRMTVQAANSLLKLLEEPPPGWVFFLSAADPSLLLPTLVSRCQTLRLRPLSHATIGELLRQSGAPSDRHAVAIAQSQGSWRKAQALCEDETWDARKQLLKFIDEPQAELSALVDWAASEPSHFTLLLDQLEQMTAELIRWSLDPATINLSALDSKKTLSQHAASLCKKLGSAEMAREFWFAQSERLFEARQTSLAPLNRKLLTQNLLMPWLSPGTAA